MKKLFQLLFLHYYEVIHAEFSLPDWISLLKNHPLHWEQQRVVKVGNVVRVRMKRRLLSVIIVNVSNSLP